MKNKRGTEKANRKGVSSFLRVDRFACNCAHTSGDVVENWTRLIPLGWKKKENHLEKKERRKYNRAKRIECLSREDPLSLPFFSVARDRSEKISGSDEHSIFPFHSLLLQRRVWGRKRKEKKDDVDEKGHRMESASFFICYSESRWSMTHWCATASFSLLLLSYSRQDYALIIHQVEHSTTRRKKQKQMILFATCHILLTCTPKFLCNVVRHHSLGFWRLSFDLVPELLWVYSDGQQHRYDWTSIIVEAEKCLRSLRLTSLLVTSCSSLGRLGERPAQNLSA